MSQADGRRRPVRTASPMDHTFVLWAKEKKGVNWDSSEVFQIEGVNHATTTTGTRFWWSTSHLRMRNRFFGHNNTDRRRNSYADWMEERTGFGTVSHCTCDVSLLLIPLKQLSILENISLSIISSILLIFQEIWLPTLSLRIFNNQVEFESIFASLRIIGYKW